MNPLLVLFAIAVFCSASQGDAGDEPSQEATTSRLAAAEPSDSQVAVGDRRFLQLAADRGAREIQLSQRAQQKTTNTSVKEFSGLMVHDHSQSNSELLKLSSKLMAGGGPPYKQEDKAVRREIAELDALNGNAFDVRYMALMIKDHEDAISEFEREAKNGKDPELKALAQKMLPTLRNHLEKARELMGSLDK